MYSKTLRSEYEKQMPDIESPTVDWLQCILSDLHVYTNLPGAPLQNCFDLYDSVTSTTPGICLGGVCTFMACDVSNWNKLA